MTPTSAVFLRAMPKQLRQAGPEGAAKGCDRIAVLAQRKRNLSPTSVACWSLLSMEVYNGVILVGCTSCRVVLPYVVLSRMEDNHQK